MFHEAICYGYQTNDKGHKVHPGYNRGFSPLGLLTVRGSGGLGVEYVTGVQQLLWYRPLVSHVYVPKWRLQS